MNNNSPSRTYKLLYHQIIYDLFIQICNNKENYCVKYKVGEDTTPIAIYKKFEEYKNKALNSMHGNRLDRHKLASCICGAIIETQPLVGYNGATIREDANEILAMFVGVNVIKMYMIHDIAKNMATKKKRTVTQYLKENFNIQFPSLQENICDTQEYKENLANALFWSHHFCDIKKDECYHYDIWAYSKIFYHLEVYNLEKIKAVYDGMRM